jgi:hypothetical protein
MEIATSWKGLFAAGKAMGHTVNTITQLRLMILTPPMADWFDCADYFRCIIMRWISRLTWAVFIACRLS